MEVTVEYTIVNEISYVSGLYCTTSEVNLWEAAGRDTVKYITEEVKKDAENKIDTADAERLDNKFMRSKGN
jgi:hypothetical protein